MAWSVKSISLYGGFIVMLIFLIPLFIVAKYGRTNKV